MQYYYYYFEYYWLFQRPAPSADDRRGGKLLSRPDRVTFVIATIIYSSSSALFLASRFWEPRDQTQPGFFLEARVRVKASLWGTKSKQLQWSEILEYRALRQISGNQQRWTLWTSSCKKGRKLGQTLRPLSAKTTIWSIQLLKRNQSELWSYIYFIWFYFLFGWVSSKRVSGSVGRVTLLRRGSCWVSQITISIIENRRRARDDRKTEKVGALLRLFHLPIVPARFLSPSLQPSLRYKATSAEGRGRIRRSSYESTDPRYRQTVQFLTLPTVKSHFIEMRLFCHYLTTLVRFSTWLLRSKAKCFNWTENTFYFFLFLVLFKIPRTLQELAVSKSVIYPKSG